MTKTIQDAFEPFRRALEVNETDTLSQYMPDNHVLFTLSGGWTGSRTVTLGDLRELGKAVEEHSRAKGSVPEFMINVLCEPYRRLARHKREEAKKSWNPLIRIWVRGFCAGLDAAAELVEMLVNTSRHIEESSRNEP